MQIFSADFDQNDEDYTFRCGRTSSLRVKKALDSMNKKLIKEVLNLKELIKRKQIAESDESKRRGVPGKETIPLPQKSFGKE